MNQTTNAGIDLDKLLNVGAQMANVMFNLAQHAGDPLTGDIVAIMDKLRKEWDLARRAEPSTNEDVLRFAIQVEKMLCAALGREWSAAGISIESLIAELAKRRAEPSVAADERKSVSLDEALYALDLVVNKMSVPGLSGQMAYAKEVLARAALASPAVSRQAATADRKTVLDDAIRSIVTIETETDREQAVLDEAIVRLHELKGAPAVSQKDGAAVVFRNDGKEPDWDAYAAAEATTASASEPEGVLQFIKDCAEASGGMVNGNRLAMRARELLDFATAPSWDAATVAPSLGTLEFIANAQAWARAYVAHDMIEERRQWRIMVDGLNNAAALARAPLPGQGDGKKCQYPNCGCTSRATCNFNYDAAPAQAGDALAALLTRIDDAFEAYERYGAICEFEGHPMIYADTLTEIVTLRGEYHAAMSASQDQKGGAA